MKPWLKVAQVLAGLWGLAGVVWCVLLIAGRVPADWLWPDPQHHLPVLMLAMFVPFAFTVARMTQVGLNTRKDAPKWHQRQFMRRLGEVWRRFPLSATLTYLLFFSVIVAFFALPLAEDMGWKAFAKDSPLIAVIMFFYALVAFMNLRVLTGGGRLIAKWNAEDEPPLPRRRKESRPD